MAEAIFQWDSGILLWIQDSLRSGFLTPIMNVITHLGDKGILWILLTIALLMVPVPPMNRTFILVTS